MVEGQSPWVAFWTHPRAVIKSLNQERRKYGVFILSMTYALQALLYFANYWSLGLSYPSIWIALACLALCPVIGIVWVYLAGWVLFFTGRWCRGRAPQASLRLAAAWSKLPTCLNLCVWLTLLLTYPDYVFIQDAGGPTIFFTNFIAISVNIWAFILLIQSVRELQGFSVKRTLFNLFLAWAFYYTILFFIFMIFRAIGIFVI